RRPDGARGDPRPPARGAAVGLRRSDGPAFPAPVHPQVVPGGLGRHSTPGRRPMTTPGHHEPRRYLVRHVTTYSYDADCVAAYERGRLRPRETPYQQVLESELHIDPEPGVVTEHRDHFGNHSHFFE